MIEIKVIEKVSGIQTHGGLVQSQEEATQFIEKFSFSWGEPESFDVMIEDITAKIAQEKINQECLKFLAETDWKIIRHKDQLDLGISTSLTAQEFQVLLEERQLARSRIVR